MPHLPVMCGEALEFLAPADGEVYVDGTFGAGGHTAAILRRARCTVIAIDRDPSAREYVEALRREFGGRLIFIPGRFSAMRELLAAHGIKKVNGILLDLGVSSMQLDTAERGFSFAKDGPLDMRMEQSGRGAADLVSQMPERELADIIYQLGGERMSRRIARAIVRARETGGIARTAQLAEIVRRAVGKYGDDIHPATRTFQALRIWVNDELGELERALAAAEEILAPGGRLVVITFHSGEDGLVKKFLAARSGARGGGASRHAPAIGQESPGGPIFSLLTRRAVKPQEKEVLQNPRARSAKLRAAMRVTAECYKKEKGK